MLFPASAAVRIPEIRSAILRSSASDARCSGHTSRTGRSSCPAVLFWLMQSPRASVCVRCRRICLNAKGTDFHPPPLRIDSDAVLHVTEKFILFTVEILAEQFVIFLVLATRLIFHGRYSFPLIRFLCRPSPTDATCRHFRSPPDQAGASVLSLYSMFNIVLSGRSFKCCFSFHKKFLRNIFVKSFNRIGRFNFSCLETSPSPRRRRKSRDTGKIPAPRPVEKAAACPTHEPPALGGRFTRCKPGCISFCRSCSAYETF